MPAQRTTTKAMLASVALLLLAACATPKSDPTLYEELGSGAGIAAIVNGLLLELAEDERIRHHFTNLNIAGFRARLETHFCEITDGPCTFEGRSMQESHKLLGIKEADFNALVEDLI
ncbi:MAG TPA: group 1 truncated hemoglobin, partial [Woeseiaceae bacterium]